MRVLDLFCGMGGLSLGIPTKEPPREEDWGLPYFRRAFADYFDGVGQSG
jgi:hypothetical protein